MAGGGDSGAHVPYEAPNSLSSAQTLKLIDVVSEGELAGFANGNDAPFKSIFFNDTPVQNWDGSFNFKGVTGYFMRGTPNQSYVPSFPSSEKVVGVSAQVKKANPITRTVTDPLVDRLIVTVAIERNAVTKDNGDVLAGTTKLRVELLGEFATGAPTQEITFTEKSSGTYYQDVEFTQLPKAPFNVRVTRLTNDSTTDRVQNSTYFSSYVEIIDSKLSYPHTALAALEIDSDQFGNSVPRRNYLVNGKLIKVPAHYDPVARTYASGVWDGSFKLAWSNNPAWVFYDLVTQPRYSTLARRLKLSDIDKWSLYQIAKYCDQPVPDGFGGTEPRFVCNAYITEQRQAGELLLDLASVFTGLPVWNGTSLTLLMDKPSDPVAIYTNSNVVDGKFTYSSTSMKGTHTAIQVQYIDKFDGYRTKTEYVADNEAIKRYGLNVKSIVAFGCDSRGQAARFGAWTLQTELRQQNVVSFVVGREGLNHLPYDVIQVMDNDYAGTEFSGRVKAVQGAVVTLDKEVSNPVGKFLQFVRKVEGLPKVVSFKVASALAPNKLQLETDASVEVGEVWGLTGEVYPRFYRAISIAENTEDGTYTIQAVAHDPEKYSDIDNWAVFEPRKESLHTYTPIITTPDVRVDSENVVVSWGSSTSGAAVTYDIKLFKSGQLYRQIPDATSPELRFDNLPVGDYKVEIRGRNVRGVLSEPVVKYWSIHYNIYNLTTTPRTLAIQLNWVVPESVTGKVFTEIWYSKTNDIQTAKRLATLSYPQDTYTLPGVSVLDTYYFWARLGSSNGVFGEFTPAVVGRADQDPTPLVNQLTGAISASALSQDLVNSILQSEEAVTGFRGELDTALATLNTNFDSAIGGVNSTVKSTVGALETKVSQVNTRVSTLDETLNTKTSSLANTINSKVADVNTSLTNTINSKVADVNTSLTNTINSKVTATNTTLTNTINSKVTTLNNTITSTKSELNNTINSTASTLNGSIKTVDTKLGTLNTKLRSVYSLKTEAISTSGQRVIAGLALGADAEAVSSQVLVYADTFGIVDPTSKGIKIPFAVKTVGGRATVVLDGDLIASGTILGKHIAAGQTLSSPNISGGSLNIGTGAFLVGADGKLDIGKGSFIVDKYGNVTLTKGTINIANNFAVNSSGDVTIKRGSINIGNNFIVDNSGNVTLKRGSININNNFVVDNAGNVTAGNLTARNGRFEGKVLAQQIEGSLFTHYSVRDDQDLHIPYNCIVDIMLSVTSKGAYYTNVGSSQWGREQYQATYYSRKLEVTVRDAAGGETTASVYAGSSQSTTAGTFSASYNYRFTSATASSMGRGSAAAGKARVSVNLFDGKGSYIPQMGESYSISITLIRNT